MAAITTEYTKHKMELKKEKDDLRAFQLQAKMRKI